MSNCTEKIKTDECIKTRDDGYRKCDKWADEGSDECDSWTKRNCHWYSPWNCIAGWFCKAYYWVSKWVCKGYSWVENIVCVAWKYITKWTCLIIDLITTIIGILVVVIDFVIGVIGVVVGLVWGVILAIPIIGAIIDTIFNVIKTIVYGILSIPDAILTLIGIMPEKKLRLLVYIQKDEKGNLVVPEKEMDIVKRYLQYAINTYRKEVNVRLVQVKFFTYNSAFQGDTTPLDKFIRTDDFWSTSATLDVCCDACAFGQDLLTQGSIFNIKMSMKGAIVSGRRIIGYGAPIIAFSVRSFTDGKAGCSLGPLSDYVTVKFKNTINRSYSYDELQPDRLHDNVTSLAHEIGHACNLPHKDDHDNLMSSSPDRLGKLTRWQKVLVRSSRHVTYF